MCEGRLGRVLINFLFCDSGPVLPRGLKKPEPAHSCWFGFVCCDSVRCLSRSFREAESESSVSSGLFEVSFSAGLTDANWPY